MSQLSKFNRHWLGLNLIHQALLVLSDVIEGLSLLAYYALIGYILLRFFLQLIRGLLLIDIKGIECLFPEIAKEPVLKVYHSGANQRICVRHTPLIVNLQLYLPIFWEGGVEFIRALELGVQIIGDFFVSLIDVLNLLLKGVVSAIPNYEHWERVSRG